MKPVRLTWGVGVLVVLGLAALIRAQEPLPEGQDGIVVQARGPVHEAYAQPAEANPEPAPVVPKGPPEPIAEQPPDQRPEGDNVQWIPGYWAWDPARNDYLWVSGFWRVPPPGRRWVPGHWVQVEGGWQWVPGFWAAADREEVPYQPEPPQSVESGPSVPAPDEDSIYAPGSWVYQNDQYRWRPGSWMTGQPGWIWTPARYSWTPAGCVFVDGYWDHCLEDRGLLYAPVAFDQPLWQSPDWCYTPQYAVGLDGLLASLFARPRCGHYYFGDYYDQGYLDAGYQPWYQYGPRSFDPLFGYYRFAHRHDPSWNRDLRDLYLARRNGFLERPRPTLREQNFLLRNNVSNFVLKNTRVTDRLVERNFNVLNVVGRPRQVLAGGPGLSALAAPHLAAQRTGRLITLAGSQRLEHQSFARQVQQLGQGRARFESPSFRSSRGPGLVSAGGRPAGSLRLPPLAGAFRSSGPRTIGSSQGGAGFTRIEPRTGAAGRLPSSSGFISGGGSRASFRPPSDPAPAGRDRLYSAPGLAPGQHSAFHADPSGHGLTSSPRLRGATTVPGHVPSLSGHSPSHQSFQGGPRSSGHPGGGAHVPTNPGHQAQFRSVAPPHQQAAPRTHPSSQAPAHHTAPAHQASAPRHSAPPAQVHHSSGHPSGGHAPAHSSGGGHPAGHSGSGGHSSSSKHH